MNTNKNKHLTINDRYHIFHCLENRLSFKAIGRELGKDCTTISKEVKGHILFEKKGAPYRPFNNCKLRRHCHHNHDLCDFCTGSKASCSNCKKCTSLCPDFIKEDCSFLLKPPYVCNGCPQVLRCTLEKHLYDPKFAQEEYEATRSEARSGINLTENELKVLNDTISPLLKNGQSVHHILTNNSDIIPYCDKTIYSYTNLGLFDARNIDMPRLVRFKPRKQKSVSHKVDKSCRIGRTFQDFKRFIELNPSLPVVQLDSVEGVKGSSVLLTVFFVRQSLQLAFLRKANNSQSVIDTFNHLYQFLGRELYCKLFPILLADNGTEFSNPKALEFDENGNRRSYVFYCDPSSPGQKGGCEVNHEFIRRIVPKGIDFALFSTDQISLMMDHINSYSRPDLGDKSPYEMFDFYYGKELLDLLGIHRIQPNDIILKPALLTNN